MCQVMARASLIANTSATAKCDQLSAVSPPLSASAPTYARRRHTDAPAGSRPRPRARRWTVPHFVEAVHRRQSHDLRPAYRSMPSWSRAPPQRSVSIRRSARNTHFSTRHDDLSCRSAQRAGRIGNLHVLRHLEGSCASRIVTCGSRSHRNSLIR